MSTSPESPTISSPSLKEPSQGRTRRSSTCSMSTKQNSTASTGPRHSQKSTSQSRKPQPKEASITKKILTHLNKLTETWAFKVHGGAFQTAGLPDVICITQGRVVFLEVKRPGGKVSPVQAAAHRKIHFARGHVFVVESLEQVIGVIGCLNN